jgi:hypothetical protein
MGWSLVFATPPLATRFDGNTDKQNYFAEGVDGLKTRCRMGGSPGTKCFGAIFKRRLQVIDL